MRGLLFRDSDVKVAPLANQEGPPWCSGNAPQGSQAHRFESWPQSEVRKGIHSGYCSRKVE
ncbi:hypothetical protein E2C01_000354 [Portunus trituberculatus]|uniref:Uncharacterized protein n=1 Tax=Portunus trituberculatus TaxID=210409 RepID=A0A5B7CEG0_PORTR|nr:hypothetical protein [Portunus trituberculatus]